MPRSGPRAVAAVAVAAVLSVGCTAEPGGDGPSGSEGPVTDPTAEPGTYSGLPEACGAPGQDRLQELLPGADAAALEGTAQVTYSTSRRVGCSWSSRTDAGAYELTVDLLRVISYDPEVSDDDQAVLEFTERAAAAGVRFGADTQDPPEPPDEGAAGHTDGAADAGAAGEPGSPSRSPDADGGPAEDASGAGRTPDADGSSPAGTPADALAAGPVDGLGDAAYLDDRLSEDGRRREITVTFHRGNVIVTVGYTVTPAADGTGPDTEGLGERARSLAGDLADRLDG